MICMANPYEAYGIVKFVLIHIERLRISKIDQSGLTEILATYNYGKNHLRKSIESIKRER